MINCAFDIHVLLKRGSDRWKGKIPRERSDQVGEGLGGGVPLPGQEKNHLVTQK